MRQIKTSITSKTNLFNRIYVVLRKKIDEMSLTARLNFFAFFIGIIGGIGAWLFRLIIELVYYLMIELPRLLIQDSIFSYLSWLPFLFAPILGGILVGLIVSKGSKETKGDGVPIVIDAVSRFNGIIDPKIPFIKIIASSLTIGSGGSAGREAPVFQIGGGFASVLGQKLKLNPKETRTLVIAGVGASISAIFNAPIGGAIFAVEILMREGSIVTLFIPIIIACVVGTVVGQILLGSEPTFIGFPSLTYNDPTLIPFFIILGLVCGIASALWIKTFYKSEDLIESQFHRFHIHDIFQPAVGGVLVGLILTITFFFVGNEWESYSVMGKTYAPMDAIFSGHFFQESFWTIFFILGVLFILKLAATLFTINTGGSGGTFAPTLFLGAFLGAFCGLIIKQFFYISESNFITLFAVLGMAAFFAGTMRCPLASIIMTAEMTNDYFLTIPLMVVIAVSWFISSRIESDDIYTLKLARRGIKPGEYRLDVLKTITVSEVMVPREKIITIDSKTRLEEVLLLIRKTRFEGFPVFDGNKFIGIITLNDIEKALEDNPKDWIVGDIVKSKKPMICIDKDATLAHAIGIMIKEDISRLPVVKKLTTKKLELVGWITQRDISRGYMEKQASLALSELEEHTIFYSSESE